MCSGRLTGNGVSGIKFIFVFNEAKATHELDLGDLATSILGEVVLNVRLGSCMVQVSMFES
jgi:hypothetical protein